MPAKILFLAMDKVPGIGAVGQHLCKLIPELADRADVDAMSVKSEDLAHIQRLGAARMMRVPTPEGNCLKQIATFQRAVTRQLESDNYDLIFCTDIFSGHTAANHPVAKNSPLMLELFDLPSVSLRQRHGYKGMDARFQKAMRHQEELTLQAAHRVIVHSDAAVHAVEQRGVAPQKISVIPLGVDTTLFAPPSIEVRVDPNACFIALELQPFLLPYLEEVIRVVSKLPKRVVLLLIRDVDDKEVLLKTAAKYGFGNRLQVEMATNAEQLAEIYNNVDIGLIWHRWSQEVIHTGQVPMAMLNAMSFGRPVICTDGPGPRQLLGASEAGVLCRRGDLESLFKRLSDLVLSSGLRSRIGTQGRELVTDRNHWGRVFPQLLATVEDVFDRDLPVLKRQDGVAESTPSADVEQVKTKHDKDNEVMHTPVVPRPQRAQAAKVSVKKRRTPQPQPAVAAKQPPPLGSIGDEKTPPGAPLPQVLAPQPLALGLSDTVDAAIEGDPWIHDTIATPTHIPLPDKVTETPAQPQIPGLKSVALMDSVGDKDAGDDKTEIMPMGDGPIPESEETERLVIDDKLVKQLYGSMPADALEDEETVRLPAYSEPTTQEVPIEVVQKGDNMDRATEYDTSKHADNYDTKGLGVPAEDEATDLDFRARQKKSQADNTNKIHVEPTDDGGDHNN